MKLTSKIRGETTLIDELTTEYGLNRGIQFLYLIQTHVNEPIYLALAGITPLIAAETSPILQDNSKNSPY
jgi:hypothetical protein